MKVLAVIDSFKGTITSKRLGELTKEELRNKNIECDYLSISDGGEGFLDAISNNLKLNEVIVNVSDPLYRKINCRYLIDCCGTAYVELAESSGICLVTDNEKNPFVASTYGLGEVIKDAINKGNKNIIVGIGGSATNDGGSGMLEALGCKFYNNDKLIYHISNRNFKEITKVDDTEFKKFIEGVKFTVISDVTNPLLGKYGATYVFSRQKGAKEEDLPILEDNMAYYGSFKKEYIESPGSGAAGGVGFAFHAYFNAKFYPGIDYILDSIDFDNLALKYDYIITGEGKVDDQSFLGKVVFRIAERAKNNKVVIVCAINETKGKPLDNIYSINSVVSGDVTTEMSMNEPEKYYRELIKNIKL